MLPHLFKKIGHRYVNMEIKPIKIIHSASIISDPNNVLTSGADKSASRWQRSNSRKIYICKNDPQKNLWWQANMTKIFIHTDMLQHLFWGTWFVLCSSSDFLNSYTTFIPLFSFFSFFSLTPLHSYDDTAFTSIPVAYLAISKAGIMPLNYTSYIWEIKSEPRHYNPSIRNLSNLHRLCADFSISAIWILLRVRKERAVYMQDLVFERQNSELY